MLKDTSLLLHEMAEYASPKARLTRLVQSGQLVRLRRGLYVEAGDSSSPFVLAAALYGPSYISFETALAHHGLIPELVQTVTSAVYNKNRNKVYHTPRGSFSYQGIPAAAFPHEMVRDEDQGRGYLMASAEKALCDLLYKTVPQKGLAGLEALILEDWRIEADSLQALNARTILFLSPLYHSRNLSLLARWVERGGLHA